MTRPLSYARHKNSRRVLITIVTTWIISAFVSSPIVLGINYTDRRLEHPSLCTFYNADFLIYSSMASFYVPCVIMTVLYGRIFVAIRRRERKNKTLAPSSSSAAAARRLSCAGGASSTLCPPPVSVQTTAVVPRPLCALLEVPRQRSVLPWCLSRPPRSSHGPCVPGRGATSTLYAPPVSVQTTAVVPRPLCALVEVPRQRSVLPWCLSRTPRSSHGHCVAC